MSAADGVDVVIAAEELASTEAAITAAPAERIRLMRDALVNASGILLPSAMALLLVPMLLGGLGAPVYGLWIAALAMSAIASSFDLGLGWTVVRRIASDAGAIPSPGSVSFFQAAAKAYLLMGVVSGTVVAIAGVFARAGLDPTGPLHSVAPWIFGILAVAVVGERMTAFSIAVLHGMRRFGTAVLLMSGFAVVRALVIGLLLWSGAGVRAVVAWHMIAALSFAAIGMLMLARLQPAFRVAPRGPVLEILRPHLHFGLASQFTSVATSITWQAGALCVGAFASAAAIVPLHVGQRFPLFASGIGWRAAEVAFPAAGERGNGSGPAGGEILRVSTRWPLAAVLPMCLVLFILAPFLLQVWLGHVEAEAVAVLRFTCLAVVCDVLGVGAIHLLWGSGRAGTVLKILGCVSVVTVALTVALVPVLGTPAAALALAIALSGGAIASLMVAAKACHTTVWDVLSNAIVSTALPALACAAATVALARFLEPANWPELALTIVVAALVYVLSMYRFGLSAQERTTLRVQADLWNQRPDRTEVRRKQSFLRSWLKRIGPLRSLWHFVLDACETLLDSPQRAQLKFDELHRDRRDPWDYSTIPVRGVERFQRVSEQLNQIAQGNLFDRVLEIGCSEGLYTIQLAAKCRALLAVDISQTALDRARAQCSGLGHVDFRTWDLRQEEMEEGFDLVVAMGVLESLGRPWDLRAAREKLVGLLRPGGWLLVETTRVNPPMENQWWRRKLHRGPWLNAYFGEHPQLVTVATATELTAIRSVFKKLPVSENAC